MAGEKLMFHYPESWAALSNKELRITLLAFLKELAGQDIAGRQSVEPERQVDIDEIFHFFFDDTDFWCNASGYIGEALLDIGEATTVTKVTQHLEEIFKLLGNQDDQIYIASSEWGEVARCAKIAYLNLQSGNKEINIR
jgi:hypothetical protein